MLVMKSTVAVYIHYKWHKFCLVNSQLAGAYTHSNHFGDSGVVHPSVQFLPRNILKCICVFCFKLARCTQAIFAEAAVERTPDSPPSELCKLPTQLVLLLLFLLL